MLTAVAGLERKVSVRAAPVSDEFSATGGSGRAAPTSQHAPSSFPHLPPHYVPPDALTPAAPSTPHWPATIHGAGATDVGHVRLVNQDTILVAPDLGLYAVIDGVGGGPAGDVAARMAADVMAEYVRMRARSRRRWPAKCWTRRFARRRR